MRLKLELGPYRVRLANGARQSLTHLKLHRARRYMPWSRHLVWWRFSVHVDTPDLDEVRTCPYCGAETEERHAGDEGLTFCTEGCGCLEGVPTVYSTVRALEDR